MFRAIDDVSLAQILNENSPLNYIEDGRRGLCQCTYLFVEFTVIIKSFAFPVHLFTILNKIQHMSFTEICVGHQLKIFLIIYVKILLVTCE